MRYLLFLLLFPFSCFSQTEMNDMITYDTTISIFTPPWGPTNVWQLRITRPANGDTLSRPAIITMPGEGQQGNTSSSNLSAYGPHYWLGNGWNGNVQLGNGTHYPLLITICYVNEVYTNVQDVYNVIDTVLTHYHIKRNSIHYAGLSEGAFTWGSLVAYEKTQGAQTGMQVMTSLVAMEGTPNPSVTQPNNTLGADTPLYKIWAAKYHGKYFYLEGSGSDNFRNGYDYSGPMNDTVAGSAYFSYEDDGGGAHCCWNDFYNPAVTNWTCVGAMGTYNSPSQAGRNTMGTYQAPGNIYQWMLRQGDTTLVGSATVITPPPPPAGLLLPVATTAQLATITPTAGLVYYNSTTGKITVGNGTAWQ